MKDTSGGIKMKKKWMGKSVLLFGLAFGLQLINPSESNASTEYIAPETGDYLIILRGQDGGGYANFDSSTKGYGDVVAGYVYLTKGQKLYYNFPSYSGTYTNSTGDGNEKSQGGGKANSYNPPWNKSNLSIQHFSVGDGGNAADVRLNEDKIENQIMVAGGGGGSTPIAKGGNAGMPSGLPGEPITIPEVNAGIDNGFVGTGGTDTAPGAYKEKDEYQNEAGKRYYGGNAVNKIGAGGGGGYYGGSSGAGSLGAGGGGSSYIDTSVVKNAFRINASEFNGILTSKIVRPTQSSMEMYVGEDITKREQNGDMIIRYIGFSTNSPINGVQIQGELKKNLPDSKLYTGEIFLAAKNNTRVTFYLKNNTTNGRSYSYPSNRVPIKGELEPPVLLPYWYGSGSSYNWTSPTSYTTRYDFYLKNTDYNIYKIEKYIDGKLYSMRQGYASYPLGHSEDNYIRKNNFYSQNRYYNLDGLYWESPLVFVNNNDTIPPITFERGEDFQHPDDDEFWTNKRKIKLPSRDNADGSGVSGYIIRLAKVGSTLPQSPGYSYPEVRDTIDNFYEYTPTSEGKYYGDYVAIDKTNNRSEARSIKFQIDWTPPTGVQSQTTTTWTKSDVNLNLNQLADGQGSGYDYAVTPNGTLIKSTSITYAVTKAGTYTIRAYDKAGNFKDFNYNVQYDNTKPKLLLKQERNTTNPSLADISIVEASDTQSGVDYLLLPNNTKTTNYTQKYTVNRNGKYKFTLVDKVGNINEQIIEVNVIDDIAPTAELFTVPSKTGYVLRLDNIQDLDSGVALITLPDNTTKPGAGVTTVEYPVTTSGTYQFKLKDNQGNERTYSETVTIEDLEKGVSQISGLKSAEYMLTGAENTGWTRMNIDSVQDVKGYDFSIDTPGTTSVVVSMKDKAENETVVVKNVTVSDAGEVKGVAPMKHIRYKMSGAVNTGWKDYNAPFELKTEGKTTILIQAEDMAGNLVETEREVWIDTSAPINNGVTITLE